MNSQKISISIIIPIYNGAQYLERCLKSVLNQTLKEIEIICIDDGSTDNSAIILEQYKKRYSEKLMVFHTKNQGVWKARALGIEKSCGMYVGFVDCDDYIEAEMYEKMFTVARRYQAEMAVTAYQRIVERGSKQKVTVEMNTWKNTIWEVGDDLYQFPFLNTALWNKIILREVAIKHIRFLHPPRIAEDVLFLMSIYPYIRHIVFLTTPLYYYYVHNGSAMSYVNLAETDNILKGFLETKDYINSITDDERWGDIIEISVYIHLGISLLLRCRLSESQEYIKRVRRFLKSEFPGKNVYMQHFKRNGLLKVKFLQIMYSTRLICFVPYLKKYMMWIIKW